ncbi:Hypothetical predicted protein [Cloeon dipterum]|uniref:Uncharacterized protein n=1 Tax=Cloeon dipterum TaxID=197152 RepID=A0A8S1CRN7_9INSE|nr:Hypothetical predicted protein [Cloeon dipterum]
MTWSEIIETVEPDSVISTVDCSPENMKRREEDAILKAINYNIQLLPHSGKDNSSFYADLPLEELLRIDAEKAKSDAVITCVRAETFREKENMLSQAKTAHQALGMDVNSAFHANHLVGKSFKKFAQLSKKLYAMIFERSTMQSLDLHNLHKKEAIFVSFILNPRFLRVQIGGVRPKNDS